VKALGAEGRKQFDEWAEAAQKVHNRNKHKLNSPMNLNIL
jgi:hypothetical protein